MVDAVALDLEAKYIFCSFRRSKISRRQPSARLYILLAKFAELKVWLSETVERMPLHHRRRHTKGKPRQ
jgi:hypothetical protein